ncbi:MAG: hypothetical protein JWP01_1140 [Myxococcales bacterium]|nr:hypothetical protein [Myxococcales bacterium]
MTMLDLGPERPGVASDTRQMSDMDRARAPARVSGRFFWVGLVLIVAAIIIFALSR